MTSPVAKHLFDETIKEMRRQGGSGKIMESFERQSASILGWLDKCVNEVGVETTVSACNDFVAMNQSYDGIRPFFNDVVEARNELVENGIERDTLPFRAQVSKMGERGLMDSFKTDEDGNPQSTGYNPYRQLDNHGKPKPSALEAALAHNQEELRMAIRNDDEEKMQSYTRNVHLIEQQLEREQAAQPVERKEQTPQEFNEEYRRQIVEFGDQVERENAESIDDDSEDFDDIDDIDDDDA